MSVHNYSCDCEFSDEHYNNLVRFVNSDNFSKYYNTEVCYLACEKWTL